MRNVTASKCRTAMALVLVLWAIAMLALLAGGLSFAVRQNVVVTKIRTDRMIAHHLARAGVERAIAEIMDDVRSVDAADDPWCDDASAFQEIELPGGTFTVIHGSDESVPRALYGAWDECAKLNVNVASHAQLMKLPDMTSDVASAIIDWRDDNEQPESDGVERSYYLALPHPYTIRNGPLKTVRELLLVRGVTPELFYGEDLNVNGLLDAGENDGDRSAPHDNADGRLDPGWFAYLTVYSYEKNVNAQGEQRLNVNTADAPTLARRLLLESWAAQSIVKAREKKKFEHLVDLLDVQQDPNTVSRDEGTADLHGRGDSEKNQPVTQSMFKEIVDEITLKDDKFLPGRINVNTAALAVLKALPEMDDELAQAIARQRQGTGSFTSIGELLDVNGMTKEKFGKIEDSVTVRSNVFRILSIGRAASGLAQATIECVVDRSFDVPRVLYWHESSP